MMQGAIVFFIVIFLICTCHDEEQASRAAEEARIQREVKQRVERQVADKEAAIEKKYGVRQAQLRTIRVVGFILLAGGALGGLIWLQRHRSYIPPQEGERPLQMPGWSDHYPVPGGRVLDLQQPSPSASFTSPAPQSAWNENNTPPRRRRASRRRHRNRNRNRNQDYDETPRNR